ncbi:MAG: hypothetical protein WC503_03820, partial [Candidatus Shapirobacteria bacterium]
MEAIFEGILATVSVKIQKHGNLFLFDILTHILKRVKLIVSSSLYKNENLKKMKRLGFAQIPLMIGLLLMALAVPVATKLVQNNQDTRNKAAYDCIGEGGMVANGTAPCCTGLEKTQCGGSGSFTYCYCKKPAANPTVTPPTRSCVTWTWVNNVCTSRTYTKASSLACDPSNCTKNDPTPKACIKDGSRTTSALLCCTKVTHTALGGSELVCGPTPTVSGGCAATSNTPALTNGQTYCQTPYLLGSRKWTCTNGNATVTQNYITIRDCGGAATGNCTWMGTSITNNSSTCFTTPTVLGVSMKQIIKCTNG